MDSSKSLVNIAAVAHFPGSHAMTSRRVSELQREKEIIELWWHTPGIPTDVRQKLLEMLAEVNKGLIPNKYSTASA